MNNINFATNRGPSSSTCTFYGKNGHLESVCYKKHGFPNQNNNKRVCTHCGRNRHTADICYKKHGYPPSHKLHYKKPSQINNINNDDKDTEENQGVINTKNIHITPQQYQVLADLFKHNVSFFKQAQVNQVGSFSVTTNNHAFDHSSIDNGNFST